MFYCIEIMRLIIETISRVEFCNSWPEVYTQESYRYFIVERIEKLKLLKKDFIMSL